MSKGGGKGGGSAPQAAIPPGMMDTASQLGNIGSYESQFLNYPFSLGNWAMNYATGGQGPQVTSPAGLAGPGTGYFGPSWNSGVMGNAYPWLNVQTYGTTGAGGTPGSQSATTWGWSGGTSGGGGSGPGGFPNLLNTFGGALGGMEQITGMTPPGTSPRSIENYQDTFQGNITNLENQISAGQAPITLQEQQIQGDIAQFGSNWLNPQQKPMIEQQTKSGQAQIAQNLGAEGLTGSTMAAQLNQEAGLAGTAAKGQLQQGNMQMAQNWQHLFQRGIALSQSGQQMALNANQLSLTGELGTTQLGLQAQQQLFDMVKTIGSMSAQEQAGLFTEGTTGYQLMNTFMSAVTAPYSLQLQAFSNILSAETATAQSAASLAAANAQAGSQGLSSGLSALGSIFGAGGLGGAGGAAGAAAASWAGVAVSGFS